MGGEEGARLPVVRRPRAKEVVVSTGEEPRMTAVSGVGSLLDGEAAGPADDLLRGECELQEPECLELAGTLQRSR